MAQGGKGGIRVGVWLIGLAAVVLAAVLVFTWQAQQQRAYEQVREPAGAIDAEGNVRIDADTTDLKRPQRSATTQAATQPAGS